MIDLRALFRTVKYPGDAPQKAKMELIWHQEWQNQEAMRRERARERREWKESAKRGIATYDAAKAATRR